VGKVVIELATRADIEQFYGDCAAPSLRAYVAKLEDMVIAIAGITYAQPTLPLFFAEMKPEMKEHKRELVRGIRKALDAFGFPGMYAVADPKESTADAMLRHFGFKLASSSRYGAVYAFKEVPWQQQH
jgi:hypothetical protein